MIRTILSPGVELNEVDKSQYTPTTIDTFRVLLPGFSSKGQYVEPTSITSMAQFAENYGTPTNEAERYAYNAANIILGDGGEVVFARLQYNSSPAYPYMSYQLTEDIPDNNVCDLLEDADITLTSGNIAFNTIKNLSSDIITDDGSETLNISNISSKINLDESQFAIVDITKKEYDTLPYSETGEHKCLGILPVVTTAINVMAIKDLLGINMNSVDSADIVKINKFEALNFINYFTATAPSAVLTETLHIGNSWSLQPKRSNKYLETETISKVAAENTFINERIETLIDIETGSTVFDRRYFAHIGVAVFKLVLDEYSGDVLVELAESFTGSIHSSAGDAYIGNIINTKSKYIRFFGKTSALEKNKLLLYRDVQPDALLQSNVIPAFTTILGTPSELFDKNISVSDINTNLQIIFEKMGSPLSTVLDVVCDAGLSTIAQFISISTTKDAKTADKYDPNNIDISNLDIGTTNTSVWRSIINNFKNFCQSQRKDCVFVTESPRHFSLIGNNKVMDLNPGKRVSEVITKNIKYITGINSSYGWGYAPWFLIADAFSGRSLWMPSSPFGVGAYIRTRRHFNVWDAPAGMTRGAINVSDISFEPDLATRNSLYSQSWNYALSYTNGGTVLEGQKTYLVRPSAFDRINVRSLFLYLERRVFQAAQYFIYEPNTGYTRQQFVDTITPMFESTKAAGGIYDFMIIADETLNTADVIDNNEFRVRIGIKPTKTIEFIMIEFVGLRTGSTFEELV